MLQVKHPLCTPAPATFHDPGNLRSEFDREANEDVPENSRIEITCELFAQHGSSAAVSLRPVRPVGGSSEGPVQLVFQWYALHSAIRVDDGSAQRMMSKGDAECMLEDVGIVPRKLNRFECSKLLHATEQLPSTKGIRAAPMQTHSGMTFDEFVDLLVRIALLIYSCNWGFQPEDAIDSLASSLLMDSNDTRPLRALLARLGRLRHEKRNEKGEENLCAANSSPPAVLQQVLNEPPAQHLRKRLLKRDAGTVQLTQAMKTSGCTGASPNGLWVQSQVPAVDMGVFHVGERKNFRVTARNRDLNLLSHPRFTLTGTSLPHITAVYNEKVLATGEPRTAELIAQPDEPGCWFGHLDVELEGTGDVRRIPIYMRATRSVQAAAASSKG